MSHRICVKHQNTSSIKIVDAMEVQNVASYQLNHISAK